MAVDYIKFKIASSQSENGRFKQAVVKGIESSMQTNLDYQYCIGDIIRHALSRAEGMDIDDERFTYTFSFTLA